MKCNCIHFLMILSSYFPHLSFHSASLQTHFPAELMETTANIAKATAAPAPAAAEAAAGSVI